VQGEQTTRAEQGFSSENLPDDLARRQAVRTIIAEAFTMRYHDNARLGWPISLAFEG
jgi:hypothetical protein